MPSRIENLREIARKNPKNIVLPEGTEPRVLEATAVLVSLGIADITLIADEEEVKKEARKNSLTLAKVRIINPKKYSRREELVSTFYNLRKHKGVTEDAARKNVLENPVYFGALLVRLGEAHGFVAGASHTTSDVARAALYCIGLDETIGVMSSSFVVELKNSRYGESGLFVFGDCGIVPDPDPERLAGITISSSRLYEKLFSAKGGNSKARVAILSYSTKGSARGPSVEKVLNALAIVRKKAPSMIVDGELQLDAAIVPEVAKIKAPASPVAGRANVLIFPNLDAGNIAYKLTQRLANARVIGPLLNGLVKPASDLSRGCGVEEIVDAVTATVVRAQQC